MTSVSLYSKVEFELVKSHEWKILHAKMPKRLRDFSHWSIYEFRLRLFALAASDSSGVFQFPLEPLTNPFALFLILEKPSGILNKKEEPEEAAAKVRSTISHIIVEDLIFRNPIPKKSKLSWHKSPLAISFRVNSRERVQVCYKSPFLLESTPLLCYFSTPIMSSNLKNIRFQLIKRIVFDLLVYFFGIEFELS